MLNKKRKKFKRFSQHGFTIFHTRKAGAHENKRRKEKYKKKFLDEL